MPRPKMNAEHVSELLVQMSCSSVFKHLPLKIVKQELERLNLQSKRKRRLPAESIVYLLVMLAIYAEASINENLRKILSPIRRKLGIVNSSVPVSSAIVKARKRLGFAPIKNLFELICRPAGSQNTKGCYWKSYLITAVDGTSRGVQNTEKNFAHFGSQKNHLGKIKQARMRILGLMECGTKIFFAAAADNFNISEHALFRRVINKLDKRMLLLADRNFFNYKLWQESAEHAGALIWRMKSVDKYKKIKTLSDGSFLAEFTPSYPLQRKYPETKGTKLIARIVEFVAVFSDSTQSETIKLVTTVLSEEEATAKEIAEVYPERWLIEEGYSELNVCMGTKEKVLRSQLPELVLQELYGFMIAHYIIRVMMLESAKVNNLYPNELSFTHSLNVIKRHIAFFPCRQ